MIKPNQDITAPVRVKSQLMATPIRDPEVHPHGTHESSDLTEPKLPGRHVHTEKQTREAKKLKLETAGVGAA